MPALPLLSATPTLSDGQDAFDTKGADFLDSLNTWIAAFNAGYGNQYVFASINVTSPAATLGETSVTSLTSTGAISASDNAGGSSLNSWTSAIRSIQSSTGNATSAFQGTLPNSATGATFISQSVSAAGTGWSHFIGQSGNGTAVNTNDILIYGNGNIVNANNSYGAISDLKLKENITDCTPKLNKLNQVRIVNYNLKSAPLHKQLGVVAQELEVVFPSMIEESPDYESVTKTRTVEVPAVVDEQGVETSPATTKDEEYTERVSLGTTTKSVKYSVFVPMLIKALQELDMKHESLGAELDILSAQFTALSAKFEAYVATHP
jgi:hypothetical protein